MKQVIPLLAILLVASSTFVRTAAHTSVVAGTQKVDIAPEQATDAQRILADVKLEPYSFTYAHDGKTVTRASSASLRPSELMREVTPAISSR